MNVTDITTDSFDTEVLQSELPVVIDFWGPQCVPCLALSSVLEKLAHQYEGKVKVVKANAAQNRRLCIRLGVMGLPSFLLFRAGQEAGRIAGSVTAEQLAEFVGQAAG